MSSVDRWMIFLQGMLTASFGVAALFFLKFWRRSGDRFFLLFSLAFAVLMIQRAALTLTERPEESRAPFYALRAMAFLLIAAALIVKNRRRPDV
jgi:hypothetical protein